MATKKTASRKRGSAVGRVYEELKKRAISFNIRPGERVNEVAIALELGVSRTPLREALNLLAVDGFLTFSPKQGYSRRPLEVKEIFDLYELRLQVETGAASLSSKRATDEAIAEVEGFLNRGGEQVPGRTADDAVAFDEEFHERIIQLAENAELLLMLQNVNSRIRCVRWVELEGQWDRSQIEHRAIVQALKNRDTEQTRALLRQHIERRRDQITETVRTSYARIYVSDETPSATSPILH